MSVHDAGVYGILPSHAHHSIKCIGVPQTTNQTHNIMKKSLLFCGIIMMMTASCGTSFDVLTKTATTTNASASIYSATVADLDVASERISYTMTPSNEVINGGEYNVKRAAEHEALLQYAQKTGKTVDLLVEPEYVINKKNGKVVSITVSGRPAAYKNFRSLNDAVWCDPVFRAGYRNNSVQR